MTGLFIGRGLAGVLESARVSLRGTLPTQIGTYIGWSITNCASRGATGVFGGHDGGAEWVRVSKRLQTMCLFCLGLDCTIPI
jgi:hypothetical protein